MTKSPKSFYQKQLKTLNQDLVGAKATLRSSSVLRLALFLVGITLGYLAWSQAIWWLCGLIVVIPLFVFLVLRHNKLRYKKSLLQAKIAWNTTELKVLERDFLHLPAGTEFQEPDHAFSQDIDLFGRGSFFQYLNRTALSSGTQKLADFLGSNAITDIPERQAAIKELSHYPEWFQEFEAVATLVKTELPAETVVRWLQQYQAFVPKNIRAVGYVFAAISLIAWGLYLGQLLSGYVVFGIFLLGLGITGKYLKRIGDLSAHTTKIQSTFRQYKTLLQLLEEKEFTSVLLKQKRAEVVKENSASSKTVHSFSKLLDALDQRNNIIIGLLTNGFLLRDLFVCQNIELWIAQHKEDVAQWFNTIAFFDAYISLGNYAFNHPNHIFPKITENHITISAKQCAHPLLDLKLAVANDFEISNDQFFVITGANMAGKSTFLRTVGLQIVMANSGLPVCATAMEYAPVQLVTSMRTSDSLADDESYFFSELKRLKYIIETIEKAPHFIILDEILKGTNSTDKATGSKKFIEKLVGLEASGIIATHDLSLCEVANSSDTVKNHYFDAQIRDGELFFDYKFKEGVCQNMNASFLLKKMGIVE